MAQAAHPLSVESLAAAAEHLLGVDVMIDAFGAEAAAEMTVADVDYDFVLLNGDQPRFRAFPALADALGRVAAGRNPDTDPRLRAAHADAFAQGMCALLVQGLPPHDTAAAAEALNLFDGSQTLAEPVPVESVAAFQLLWSRPGRRPPTLLVRRCVAGLADGTVSARPVGGLLGVPSRAVLAALSHNADPAAARLVTGDTATPRRPGLRRRVADLSHAWPALAIGSGAVPAAMSGAWAAAFLFVFSGAVLGRALVRSRVRRLR